MIKLFILMACAGLATPSTEHQERISFDSTKGSLACSKLSNLYQTFTAPTVKPADHFMEIFHTKLSNIINENNQACIERPRNMAEFARNLNAHNARLLTERDAALAENYNILKEYADIFIEINDDIHKHKQSRSAKIKKTIWPQSLRTTIEKSIDALIFHSQYNRTPSDLLCQNVEHLHLTMSRSLSSISAREADQQKIVRQTLHSIAKNLNRCKKRKKIISDIQKSQSGRLKMLLLHCDATIANRYHIDTENVARVKDATQNKYDILVSPSTIIPDTYDYNQLNNTRNQNNSL